MILSAQSIRQRCMAKRLITPFHERTKHHGMTFGLSSAGYDIRAAESMTLHPKQFALGSSIEHFEISVGLIMFIHDKSSWARKGLDVKNTVAEPGWRGFLTLEYTNNHQLETLYIKRGDPIAQVIFQTLDHNTEQPYQGKYQDQPAGPQNAIEEA